MLLLVSCRKILEEKREGKEPVRIDSYGDLGAEAFGLSGRCITELLILTSYAGGAVAFLVFVSQNLSSLSSAVTPSTLILLLLLPIEACISLIRSLSVLAPISALADACNVVAVGMVLREDAWRLVDGRVPVGPRRAVGGVGSLPFAGGMVVYCFEGVGLTLALERSMAAGRRRRFPWVLLLAILGTAVVYVVFGSFGYLAFGDATEEIITLNLPDGWSAAIVKVGISVSIALSLPMALHPVHEIMETKLKSSSWFQKLSSSWSFAEWLGLRLARVVVVAVVSVLATYVPSFVVLASFTGSTVSALLTFVLPATFHLKLMGSSVNIWQRVLDYIMIVTGVVFAGYGTYAAASGHPLGS